MRRPFIFLPNSESAVDAIYQIIRLHNLDIGNRIALQSCIYIFPDIDERIADFIVWHIRYEEIVGYFIIFVYRAVPVRDMRGHILDEKLRGGKFLGVALVMFEYGFEFGAVCASEVEGVFEGGLRGAGGEGKKNCTEIDDFHCFISLSYNNFMCL